MNLNGNNGANNDEHNFHSEVEERLKWWAEKHNKSIEEARESFVAYLNSDLGISNPSEEDDDFLIEAAESFIVERRVMSNTSASNAVKLVGYFIGIDSKVRDAQERKRAPAVSAALNDMSEAIENGLVARAFTQDGVWMLEGKDGVKKTEESADEKPWFLFEEHGLSIAILQNNPDWSRFGEPITPYRWQRTYHFYGNEKENFMDAQNHLRLTVTSKDPNEWHVPQMFSECTVSVRERKNVSKGWEDVWNTLPFPSAITYGGIVEEQYADAVKPERLLPTSATFVKDLSTLTEIFETKSETIAGIPNPVGPMVLIKARVSDLRLEPSDYEYDPSGYTYFMRVTSFDLMRAFGDDNRRDVGISIHGFLGDNGHVFEYATEEGWKPYAVKSTVFIYGRLGLTKREDGDTPKISAVGIYAVPRYAIPAGEGGNTNSNQFEGDGE